MIARNLPKHGPKHTCTVPWKLVCELKRGLGLPDKATVNLCKHPDTRRYSYCVWPLGGHWIGAFADLPLEPHRAALKRIEDFAYAARRAVNPLPRKTSGGFC